MSQPSRSLAQFLTIGFILSFAVSYTSAQKSTAQNKDQARITHASTRNDAEMRPRILILDSKNSPAKPNTNFESKSAATVNESTTNYEQRAMEILNRQRQEAGLAPLTWNADLAKVARLHSKNMAQYKFFNHAGLDGRMVDGRADQVGIRKWSAIGENIAFNRGYDDPVELAYDGWMHSASHKKNILSERWKEVGIGIVADSEGTFYFTQVFLQR